jgi:UDPglucose 6-dehydrogenase
MELKGISDKRIKSKLKQILWYAQEAVDQAHSIAVLTEWDEFRTYDWETIYKVMQTRFVFDGRMM